MLIADREYRDPSVSFCGSLRIAVLGAPLDIRQRDEFTLGVDVIDQRAQLGRLVRDIEIMKRPAEVTQPKPRLWRRYSSKLSNSPVKTAIRMSRKVRTIGVIRSRR